MKCTRVQDLYFLSRDDALDESARMELARHLAECPSCARFVKEMESSLDAARSLPELEVSEAFEWNVKRRILQEKSRLMRREAGSLPFRERWWLSRFAVGAAAAAAILVVASLFVLRPLGTGEPRLKEVASDVRTGGAGIQSTSSSDGAIIDYATAGAYTGPRMVSDNIFTIERGIESVRPSAFQFVAGSREDSLARDNEALKRRIQSLEHQIMLLNGMLGKERMRRLNTSLP
ncbi:MAG TPA: zf-HC2 domain-containing protein [Candidatus Bathyarchaeia archaeon]|nr:zf-HC2 domain-containing protein [Candidatus Bathyarchaeia archaeon]